jgi:hypothetical protein
MLIAPVDIFVQQRYAGASGAFIGLANLLKFRVQYDVGRGIHLKLLHHLCLDFVAILKEWIEVRPPGCWQTLGTEINDVVVCVCLVVRCQPDIELLIRSCKSRSLW